MININRDTIAMHIRLFYFDDDSHDDPALMMPPISDDAFANALLAELRDDIDAFTSIYMLNFDDLTDRDIECAHRLLCATIELHFDYFRDLIQTCLDSYRS